MIAVGFRSGAGGGARCPSRGWDRDPPFGTGKRRPHTTQEQKIIRAKVGLLELAKQLGNVSQACKMMATAATAFTASTNCTTKVVRWPCRRSVVASQS